MTTGSSTDDFLAIRSALTDWLFDKALPLWSSTGTDFEKGGFFEKISRSGEAIEEPRRTRVVGRQIYSFAAATSIGWNGPGHEVVDHGIAYFCGHCLGDGGRAISVSRPGGVIVDGRFDLYDQAFALFGLAAAANIRDDGLELAEIARRIRLRIKEGWGHPERGFEEAVPRTLPLKANPHMHVFEASLAWIEAGATEDAGWVELADEIGQLCLEKFLHPENGCLREFFDYDWSPMVGDEGRLIEPGHQFEWAWLLVRWARMRNRPDVYVAARRLIEIAETHGVDAERGVAINELWDDFSLKDKSARLWPQTERTKAWIALASIADSEAERDFAFGKAALAARGLSKYLAKDVVGAWNERMREDDQFLDEPAPASSLYHITCAIAEMHIAGPK